MLIDIELGRRELGYNLFGGLLGSVDDGLCAVGEPQGAVVGIVDHLGFDLEIVRFAHHAHPAFAELFCELEGDGPRFVVECSCTCLRKFLAAFIEQACAFEPKRAR